MVFLVELQIINSLNSFFLYKDRNNRGIEDWGPDTLYVWLHPFHLPRVSLVPTLYIYFKSCTNLHLKKKKIKIFLLTV